MIEHELRAAAARVLDCCRHRKLKIVTAESCTGGLLAAWLTEIPGSSDVVDRGFVTYSNDAKQAVLDVAHELLEEHGAVSAATALAMARGALDRSLADIAVAVTGIAGPDGGTSDKPVGLVHFAAAARGDRAKHCEQRFGNIGRSAIRQQSVLVALELLRDLALDDDQLSATRSR
jgi:nicotinamide-nucleotide amidase